MPTDIATTMPATASGDSAASFGQKVTKTPAKGVKITKTVLGKRHFPNTNETNVLRKGQTPNTTAEVILGKWKIPDTSGLVVFGKGGIPKTAATPVMGKTNFPITTAPSGTPIAPVGVPTAMIEVTVNTIEVTTARLHATVVMSRVPMALCQGVDPSRGITVAQPELSLATMAFPNSINILLYSKVVSYERDR